MAFWCDLLLWPSGMPLVRPSGTGGSLLTETPFQPEGHNRRPYQNGLLVWPSGKAFWCDLLLLPSGMAPLPTHKKTATVADGTHPTGIILVLDLIFFGTFRFANSFHKHFRLVFPLTYLC